MPKRFLSLPLIDQLVDSTSGHELQSLMKASLGYHQIMLNLNDPKQASFITSGGTPLLHCYAFGLKNA
ncbi:UNVERIFIED_CONTAM: hypothetical protein Sradi_4890000, partial [Sesamum radiatum]